MNTYQHPEHDFNFKTETPDYGTTVSSSVKYKVVGDGTGILSVRGLIHG